MRLALTDRSVSATLLAVCLSLGLLTSATAVLAADRTVIGELYTRDG